MSGIVDVIHFAYPRRPDELRDEQRALAWLDAIARQGYYLAQDAENFRERYATALREHNPPAGVSAATVNSLQMFAAGGQDIFECSAYWLQADFAVQMALSYADGYILLMASGGDFTVGEDHQQKYDQWLALLEATYQSWRPIFGFDIGANFALPTTTRDDALALEARCLYMVNLYGPEFVAKLGRDRLLSAPAWRIKRLDDGGILLASNPFIEEDPFHPSPYDPRQVAQHLGLPSPLQ